MNISETGNAHRIWFALSFWLPGKQNCSSHCVVLTCSDILKLYAIILVNCSLKLADPADPEKIKNTEFATISVNADTVQQEKVFFFEIYQ